MALSPTRREYRITLNHVDRGVERSETVIVAQHPSETAEHLTVRVLAWCLLPLEGLAFGPGLSTPDAADLWAHDLTGRLTAWIECGGTQGEKIRKVVQHNTGAAVHVVFGDERRRDELVAELAGWRRAGEITLWTIAASLVEPLAALEGARQKWAVTVVGDHVYLDVEGTAFDGPVVRSQAG